MGKVLYDFISQINQNERFRMCWMIAVNPKQFFSFFSKEAIENLNINLLCDDVLNASKIVTTQNRRQRWPLRSIAQLLFGITMIYKNQVDFLYEQSQILFSRKIFLESLRSQCGSQKNKSTSSKKGVSKNRKLSIDYSRSLNVDVEELISNFENGSVNFANRGLKEILPPITEENTANDADITLKESLYPKCNFQSWRNFEFEKPDENCGFDDNNGNSIPLDNFDDFYSDIRDNIQCASSPISRNLQNLNCYESRKTPERHEDDLINQRNELPLSIIEFDPTNNLEKSDNNINIGTIAPITIPNQSKRKQSLENEFENLSTVNIKRLKHKHNRKLEIDNNIEYTIQELYQRSLAYDTFRIFEPRKDVVPVYEQKKISAQNLLSRPGFKIISVKLAEHFSKHLKILKKKKVSKKLLKKSKLNTNNEINEVNVTLMEPEVVFPNNMPINNMTTRRIYSQDQVLKEIFEFNTPREEHEIIKKLNEKSSNIYVSPIDVLNEHFEDNESFGNKKNFTTKNIKKVLKLVQQELKANDLDGNILHNSDHLEKIRSKFDKISVFEKLLKLWSHNVSPINMGSICNVEANTRFGAALAFSSVLVLASHRFVNIVKNNETHEIIHLDMGEKVIEIFKANN